MSVSSTWNLLLKVSSVSLFSAEGPFKQHLTLQLWVECSAVRVKL